MLLKAGLGYWHALGEPEDLHPSNLSDSAKSIAAQF